MEAKKYLDSSTHKYILSQMHMIVYAGLNSQTEKSTHVSPSS